MRTRQLLLLAAAVALAACGTKKCKTGTLLLTVQLEGAAASATQLDISVQYGGQTRSTTVPHSGGSGTIEVDFANGYPSGASAVVTVSASGTSGTSGSGSVSVTLSDSCATATVVVSPGTVAGSADMATRRGDLGLASDMSRASDMAFSPDLLPLNDMSSCAIAGGATVAFVDPANGTDDAMHGGQAGGCAFRSLTFAVAHGGNVKINLAFATYSTMETFPLFLTGTQSIDCDPGMTGNKATLNGAGDDGGNGATVAFQGTSNGLYHCNITNALSASGNGCIHVDSLGTGSGHLIQDCEVHHCGGSSSPALGTAILIPSGGNVAISGCQIHDVSNGVFNEVNNSSLKNTSFANVTATGHGIICTAAQASFTGCGVAYGAGMSAGNECSTCGNCPFTTTPCN
jgi:hypothetical protein